jgi:hypothetical protein
LGAIRASEPLPSHESEGKYFMKATTTLLLAALATVGLFAAGCGESVPMQQMPADGSNPHVSGSPQERIERIQSDTTLSQEEKDRRIALVKQRNNIK